MPAATEGAQLVKFDGRNWFTNDFTAGSWAVPEMTLSPGEAALLRSPTKWLNTFAGSILQGELKVFIPAGVSLRSSLVAESGKLSEVLQFPKIPGTKISGLDNRTGQPVLRATCTEAGWEPEEPVVGVGEGFYVEAPHDFVWSRVFAVNGQSANSNALRILSQPQSWQVRPGDSVSLRVEAASTNSLYYQWQRNGNDIPDATDPTLIIPSVGPQHLGSYWVKIWDEKSWVWSDLAIVQFAVSARPSLAIQQDSQGRGILLVSQGTSGQKATIEVSLDLIHWAELDGAEQVDSISVLDRLSNQQAARFYRLRLD